MNAYSPPAAQPAPPATKSHKSLSNPAQLLSQFNVTFALMSVIPFLIFGYLMTVHFYTSSILKGMNGVYLCLAILIAFLGLLVGRRAIQQIIRQLLEANAKLERFNSQQAAFVSNVAHEFRSPLTVIQGAMDNLLDGLHGEISPDQREPVEMCQRESARLKRLVGDLLDTSRIEAGKLRLVQDELILQDLLTHTAQLFGDLLKKRGLRFDLELPEAPAKIIGDRDRLQQVFINLVANAVKFTEQGGIRVRLSIVGEAFQVEVADTGPGIAPEDLERIFDKFERVGTETEEGSGLGLPIARDLVGLHQGRIWVESRLGQGSRFIVRLPVQQRSSSVSGQ